MPHETCIEEEKFELIKKSCERQVDKRKSLNELKESLQNMLTDAGISNYFFGSEAFSLFIFLDANKFVLQSFFSLIKTIYLKV